MLIAQKYSNINHIKRERKTPKGDIGCDWSHFIAVKYQPPGACRGFCAYVNV